MADQNPFQQKRYQKTEDQYRDHSFFEFGHSYSADQGQERKYQTDQDKDHHTKTDTKSETEDKSKSAERNEEHKDSYDSGNYRDSSDNQENGLEVGMKRLINIAHKLRIHNISYQFVVQKTTYPSFIQ